MHERAAHTLAHLHTLLHVHVCTYIHSPVADPDCCAVSNELRTEKDVLGASWQPQDQSLLIHSGHSWPESADAFK